MLGIANKLEDRMYDRLSPLLDHTKQVSRIFLEFHINRMWNRVSAADNIRISIWQELPFWRQHGMLDRT